MCRRFILPEAASHVLIQYAQLILLYSKYLYRNRKNCLHNTSEYRKNIQSRDGGGFVAKEFMQDRMLVPINGTALARVSGLKQRVKKARQQNEWTNEKQQREKGNM